MTLLIGTVARSRKPHIAVTADGRSTGFDGETRSILSETEQKIFPVAGLPIVIAHHGENRVAGMPVEEFVSRLLKDCGDLRPFAADDLADFMQSHAGTAVMDTLRRIPMSKQVGFWVAGFGQNRREPLLCEVSWTKEPKTGEITTERHRHGNLVFGGDAKVLVDEYCSLPVDGMYCWDRIPDQPSTYAIKMHNKLYGIAEQRQSAQKAGLFGGHKHQVVVTTDGWRWNVAPSKTTS